MSLSFLLFSKIVCKNILNDCLDVSGGEVQGQYLQAIDVKDKGLSFGENSTGNITNSSFARS